jgi:AraC-like DNA-binding protein
MTEIAFLLGFSESSAFSRAFKRWIGVTPTQYRKAV